MGATPNGGDLNILGLEYGSPIKTVAFLKAILEEKTITMEKLRNYRLPETFAPEITVYVPSSTG